MSELKKINLPFLETIKRSFLYVIFNGNTFLKVSFIGLVILIFEALSGFPMMCSLNPQNCSKNNIQLVSNLLIFLISAAVIINYCRAVVLKSAPDYMSLGFLRRISKYILVMLSLSFAIIVVAVLASLIFRMIGNIDGNVIYLVSAALGLILVVCMSPIFLYLAAIAIDNNELSIRQYFILSRGNYNKIFWGQTLLMFPGVILMFFISAIYQLYPAEEFIGKLVYTIFLVVASLFDTCVKGSFFAHIYQYFIFYKNKQDDIV